MNVKILKCWHDGTESVGYAEGELNGREFTASWAAWSPLGALFHDTWLDAAEEEARMIATALKELKATPPPQ